MTLTLYFHPLASFCHKVLIALDESRTQFRGHVVDLMDHEGSAEFLKVWPVGKIPVLHDESRNRTIPETTIIIEYLDQHYPTHSLDDIARWKAIPNAVATASPAAPKSSLSRVSLSEIASSTAKYAF